MTRSRRITRADLGAWVLKSNPAVRDPVRFAAEHGSGEVTRCVAASYRSGLLRPGDAVVLWVSGPDRGPLPAGVWGVGRVVAPPEPPPSPTVRLAIQPLEAPVPRVVLRSSAALAGCEVLRQPQMGNPSWLDLVEWAALQALLAGA